MRAQLAFLMFVVVGCEGYDAHAPSPPARGKPSDAGVAQPSKKPAPVRGEFQARWHEHLPLPERDVRDCLVTFSPAARLPHKPTTFTYLYFADTRTLISTEFETVYGADGMVERVYGTRGGDDPNLYATVMFDERGNLTSSKHPTSADTVFKNEYEGERLVSVATSTPGSSSFRDWYRYEDDKNPDLWTSWERDADADGDIDFTTTRVIESDRQTFTRRAQGGPITVVLAHTYRDGRIAEIEQFGGGFHAPVTDTPTLRQTWDWDERGMLLSFRSSGNAGSDVINPNESDYVETYTPGCRILEERFPWLFHEPGPRSTSSRSHPVWDF